MALNDPPPESLPGAPRSRPRRGFFAYFIGSLMGALVLVALYTMLMLWWSYSEGDRAGVLQKFSKRGWVCKTYEGELAMYVVGGVAPQIWNFSVRDDVVAEQLQHLVGQQVRLSYDEHRGLPTDCFGETDYFVKHVEKVELNFPVQPPGEADAPGVAPEVEQPLSKPAG